MCVYVIRVSSLRKHPWILLFAAGCLMQLSVDKLQPMTVHYTISIRTPACSAYEQLCRWRGAPSGWTITRKLLGLVTTGPGRSELRCFYSAELGSSDSCMCVLMVTGPWQMQNNTCLSNRKRWSIKAAKSCWSGHTAGESLMQTMQHTDMTRLKLWNLIFTLYRPLGLNKRVKRRNDLILHHKIRLTWLCLNQ